MLSVAWGFGMLKWWVLCFVVLVLGALGLALRHFVDGKSNARRMLIDLWWRMIFSVVFFAVLMFGWYMEWWLPHGYSKGFVL